MWSDVAFSFRTSDSLSIMETKLTLKRCPLPVIVPPAGLMRHCKGFLMSDPLRLQAKAPMPAIPWELKSASISASTI